VHAVFFYPIEFVLIIILLPKKAKLPRILSTNFINRFNSL